MSLQVNSSQEPNIATWQVRSIAILHMIIIPLTSLNLAHVQGLHPGLRPGPPPTMQQYTMQQVSMISPPPMHPSLLGSAPRRPHAVLDLSSDSPSGGGTLRILPSHAGHALSGGGGPSPELMHCDDDDDGDDDLSIVNVPPPKTPKYVLELKMSVMKHAHDMVERVGPEALLLTQNVAAVMKSGIEDCKVWS